MKRRSGQRTNGGGNRHSASQRLHGLNIRTPQYPTKELSMAEPMYHSQLPDYLESLVPERDPVMQEMEAYAREVGFPIIGIPGGYFLYQIARMTGARQIFE